MSEHSTDQRLTDLEQRVALLEAGGTSSSLPPSALDRMQQRLDDRVREQGLDPKVSPVGEIETNVIIRSRGGTWAWSEDDLQFERLLEASPDALAKGIGGLAHPVRIALAKALIDGPRESSALLEVAGLNTTGQLYHHLQAMADVGLVERRGRNLWAGQNLIAFTLLMYAGHQLAQWRGPDDEGEPV
jgi:hypothetical protein